MPKDEKVVWKNINWKRILIVLSVSATSLFGAGLLLYQAQARLYVHKPNTDSETKGVTASTTNSAATTGTETAAAILKSAPMLEVHVANNGLMLLRGARVISLSGATLHVITAWDSAYFTWKIQTKFSTKITTAKGNKKTLADIQVGDIITVTGKLAKGGAEPIIDAQFVEEVQKSNTQQAGF